MWLKATRSSLLFRGSCLNSLYSPSCLQHRSSQASCEKSGLFEFCHDVKNYGGIIVEINLMECDPKSVEVNTEWSPVPGHHGRPEPASIQRDGTVSFGHRNPNGLNRSFMGSVTSSNFFNLNCQEEESQLMVPQQP
uniref:Uncharacterized protein n=1 Tax=Opuntia streptacantha TaxID=393608 RepID=A0A7C8YQ22_OPUST